MKKSLLVKVFVLLLCAAVVLSAKTVSADPLPNYPGALHYQLRNVTRPNDGHRDPGPQWVAHVESQEEETTEEPWGTVGGNLYNTLTQMVTSADLITAPNPDSVYIENSNYNQIPNGYNAPALQAAYLVLTNATGTLGLNFKNAHDSEVWEDVLLSADGYNTAITPNAPVEVPEFTPQNFNIRLSPSTPQGALTYGSKLGYMAFRQSTNADGLTGFRESELVPVVVANVFDGKAEVAGNELRFDMLFFDGTPGAANEIVTRKKFIWGAGQAESRTLGTFYLIQQPNALPTYNLTAKITNRTGMRYYRQRYNSGLVYPSYWEYDLTPDDYKTYDQLPASFYLDPLSQIAPGLVTTYQSAVAIDTSAAVEEAFGLYSHVDGTPKYLTLTYNKVRGLTPGGTVSQSAAAWNMLNPSEWTLRSFTIDNQFQDAYQATITGIQRLLGGTPAMPAANANPFAGGTVAYRHFTNVNQPFNEFQISVPTGAAVQPSEVALVPMRVRLRISRHDNTAINSNWNTILGYEDAGTLAANLPSVCSIWLRSEYTNELDTHLFEAMRNRGKNISEYFEAFTYGDYLYVDFMMLLADAVSQNASKTAFVDTISYDTVNYICVGDGAVDQRLELGVFVTGPVSGGNNNNNNNSASSGSDGGSGCNAGGLGMAALSLAALYAGFKSLKK